MTLIALTPTRIRLGRAISHRGSGNDWENQKMPRRAPNQTVP
ncbi:protein of unknown function [Candidatus Bipolaricaulis anaerobius]|uniref:Uncharacterized protein n=1 Tax=Candidatus Bipolaricaulis anaerobius TaxID=2026885 RepID=A0A2X3MK77_9BACT|nr:protein of unknown function [Candidatus Bipolaricaulis anaerobius]